MTEPKAVVLLDQMGAPKLEYCSCGSDPRTLRLAIHPGCRLCRLSDVATKPLWAWSEEEKDSFRKAHQEEYDAETIRRRKADRDWKLAVKPLLQELMKKRKEYEQRNNL